jgi:putative membrane protein
VYLFFKWFHLIAVISWMAGILYLYRLLIYLVEKGENQEIHSLLSLMATRLYRYITRPAMIAAYAGGIGMLVVSPGLLSLGWLHAKIACIFGLTWATLYAGHLVRQGFQKTQLLPSSRSLRFLNEVPTLLMLVIVALAVFRPF